MPSAPTKTEVAELLLGWQLLERQAARARLRSETELLRDLRAVLRFQVSALTERLDYVQDKSKALLLIRQAADRIDDAITATVTVGRGAARDASLAQVSRELEHLRKLLTADGWTAGELPPDPTPAPREDDVAAAANVAASVSSRWGTAALSAVYAWEEDPSDVSLATAVRGTVVALSPQLETIAATEISDAFSAELEEALEPLSDYPWSAQVFKVWSAMLDGVTCHRCYELDGRAVPVDDPWPDGAYQPLHPRCRCMGVPLYIPKPRALQDVATDYAAYKAEVRDQIRASRHSKAAGRHAADFVARSRAGRSPIVISKDFAVGRLSGRAAGSR